MNVNCQQGKADTVFSTFYRTTFLDVFNSDCIPPPNSIQLFFFFLEKSSSGLFFTTEEQFKNVAKPKVEKD